MRRRFAVCVLGVWSLFASATAQAQPAPGTIPPPRIYAPAPYDASNNWPAWGVPAYDFPDDGHIYSNQQYGPGPDRFITERLPQDKGWDYEDTPVDRFLSALGKSTYLRLEYMQWNFQDPGNQLLGSSVAGQIDPSQPFRTTINGLPGTARVPTTEPLHFRDVQGIRGTIGVPTSIGNFEASFFAFDRVHADFFETVAEPLVLNPSAQIQLATSTRLNGQISTNLFLYDASFRIFHNSQIFGGEANWIGKSPYEEGLIVRPLAGFRYLDIQERLFQQGTFDQQGVLVPPLVSDIDSTVSNQIYAPQIGLRLEFAQRWFTLGFEPKVGFGVNTFDATVGTNQLRSQGDPAVTTRESGTKFSPVGDFSVYGKFHVRDNFSLTGSYQIMVASGISRPATNIFYNDNGSSQPAAIVVNPSFDNMVWQGITIGGELRFR